MVAMEIWGWHGKHILVSSNNAAMVDIFITLAESSVLGPLGGGLLLLWVCLDLSFLFFCGVSNFSSNRVRFSMVFVRSSFYKVIVLESGLHVLLYLCYFDSQFPLGCGIQRGDEQSLLFFEIPA